MTESGALALGGGPPVGLADVVPPATRRWLLLAGLAAAGAVGLLVPELGPRSTFVMLLGSAALFAALVSRYAALATLVVLLLLPTDVAGTLPAGVNALDLVYGAGLLGLAMRTLPSDERPRFSPLGLALVAYILAGVSALAAGILGAGETQTALSHFRGLFGYALIPLLVLSLGDGSAQRRRTLLWLLCAVGVLTAARGVLSWAQLNGLVQLSGVPLRLASPDSEELVGVVPALAGDFGYVRAWAGSFEGNTLGAFVVLLLPLTVYLALRNDNLLARAGFAAGALLLLVALLVSYSRGAYLGLAAASLPALMVLWRRHPLGTVALALGGVALLVFFVSQLPGAEDRLVTLQSLGDDPTVQHRQLVYEQVLDSARQNPIWGVGLGTSVKEIGTGADSLYLFLLLRGGLLVAAAFLALVWAAGRQLLLAARMDRLTGLEVAVAAGLWGVAVHSLIDYTLWNPKVAITLWLLIGLLMAAALGSPDREADGPREAVPRW